MYYKLASGDLPALLPRLRALQAQLASEVAQARLQTRVESAGGSATVMEIYDGVADPAHFGRRLDAALAAGALPEALCAARRTERFRDL